MKLYDKRAFLTRYVPARCVGYGQHTPGEWKAWPRNVCSGLLFVLLIGLAMLPGPAGAQSSAPPTPFSTVVQPDWLQEVMPAADSFGEKRGDPPTWPAYRTDPLSREARLIGHVFLSGDVPPEQRGYSGPIDLLIGVDTDHNMTGVKILDYVETYRSTKGDFLARIDLLDQFRGKPIGDDFRINRDIDGIAGSTVSVFAVARGARDAARRVAQTYLDYDPRDPVQEARIARIGEQMGAYSPEQMLDNGMVQQINVEIPGGGDLELFFTYMGHPGLGRFWIGSDAYARAERDASAWLAGDEMVLVGMGGSAAQQFRYDQLQYSQDGGRSRRVSERNFVPTAETATGQIRVHAEGSGTIILPDDIDITRPFSLHYRHLGMEEGHSLRFQPAGLAMRLARGEDVLSQAEIEAIQRADNHWLKRFLDDPPWGVTPRGTLLMLVLILGMAMTAFLRKDATLRWATLGVTVVWLGFFNGGFISVSHITNTITQGPGFLVNNLSLLLFVAFTAVTTLLWGRVFCSSLCPFGAVQDFITRLTPRRWRRTVPWAVHSRALYLKYLILALIIIMALVASDVVIFHYFEPFGTLFFREGALVLQVILIAILAACFVVPRFYCRYGCPLGAALGLVSLVSPFRIRRVPQCTVCAVCEQGCPTGAIRRERIDFKECVRCDVCEIRLIEQAGACRHDMDRIIASSRAAVSRHEAESLPQRQK